MDSAYNLQLQNMYGNEKDKLGMCIEQYEKRVHNLLDTLGWTIENTLKEHNIEPLSESIEKKYDKNDPLYPDTLVAKNFVKFDTETLGQVLNSSNKRKLPQKFSDFQIIYNKEEKLYLYEYVINKTGKLTEPEVTVLPFNENEGTSSSNTKHMTFNEIVAMRRDEKRRRLKYRTTKTAPLSVTEELRNLIEIQMQAFEQYIKQTSNELSNKIKSKHRSSYKEHKRDKTSHHHKHKKYK